MGTFKIKLKTALAVAMIFLVANVFAGPPTTWNWVRSTSNTTTIAGEIVINNFDSRYEALAMAIPPTVVEGDFIGAFVGDQCRMIAEVFSHEGTLYISGVIHGPAPDLNEPAILDIEEVEFKLWDESADAEFSLLGTEFTNPEGSIGIYPNLVLIGNPNDGNSIESMSITGDFVLSPAFTQAETQYTVALAIGQSVPSANDYLVELNDSRASYTIEEATSTVDGSNVTTITVVSESGEEQVYTITFQVDACAVAAPTVESQEVCADGDLTLTVTSEVNGEIRWYDNADLTGTPQVGTSVEVTETSTFYVTEFDGCESAYTEVTLTVIPLPTVEITNDVLEVCLGTTVTLEANALPTGGNGSWTSSPANLVTGGVLNTSEVREISVIYTYTADGCSNTDEVSFSIIDGPAAPTTDMAEVIVCQGDDIAPLSVEIVNGATVAWYNSNQELVGEDLEYTPTEAGTYSVTQTLGGCTSAETEITLIINPIPDAPDIQAVGSTQVCEGGEMPQLTAEGEGIIWYNNDGEIVGQGASYNVQVAGIYTATQTVESCTSANSDEISINVISAPELDVQLPTSICKTYGEYTLPSGSGVFHIASTEVSSFDPADFTQAVQLQYVITEGECTFTENISIAINTTPTPSVVSPVNVLINEVVPALTATGTGTLIWLDADMELVGNGETFDSEVNSAIEANTTFYVINVEGECESEPVEVIVSVSTCPLNAPTIDLTSPQNICEGENFPTITATGIVEGNVVNWYSNSSLTQLELENSATFTPSEAGTYYVTQAEIGNCESQSSSIRVIVNSLPIVSTENVPQNICETADPINLAGLFQEGVTFPDYPDGIFNPAQYTGTVTINYSYTDDATTCETSGSFDITILAAPVADIENQEVCSSLGTVELSNPNTIFTVNENVVTEVDVATAGIYTVAYTVSIEGCSANGEFTITSIESPEAPAIESLTITLGETIPTFGEGIENLVWYSDEALTMGVAEGAYQPEDPAVGINTWYAVIEGECTSAKTTVTLTVEDGTCNVPAPTASDMSKCSYTASVELTATSNSVSGVYDLIWYNANNEELARGNTYNASTVGIYYVSEYNSTAGCEGPKTTVELSNAIVPEVTIIGANNICEGDNNPTLSVNGSSSIVWAEQTSTPATPIDGTEGATYTSNATEGTVTVWASQIIEGCQSTPISASYTITPKPAPYTSIQDYNVCEGEATTISVDRTIAYYLTGEEPQIIATQFSLNPSVGNYTYNVFATENGCASDVTTFEYNVHAVPTIENTSEITTILVTEVVPELKVTSSVDADNVVWYLNGENVGTGLSYTHPNSIIGVYNYTVEATSGNCSESINIRFEITDCDIDAPTLSTNTISVCGNTNTEEVIATIVAGNSIAWKNAEGVVVSTETNFTPTVAGTYSVTQEGTCVSPASILDVQFIPEPTPTITVDERIDVQGGNKTLVVSPSGGTLESSLFNITGAIGSSGNNYVINPTAIPSTSYNTEYTLTYTVTVQGCEGSTSATIAFYDSEVLDLTPLEQMIAEVTELLNNTEIGSAVGNVSTEVHNALESALETANGLLSSIETQEEVTSAIEELQAAIEQFNNGTIADEVTGIVFNVSELNIEDGEQGTIVATFAPAGTTDQPTITWTSSDENIATVDENGTVTGVSEGSTTITASITVNGVVITQTIDANIGGGSVPSFVFNSAELSLTNSNQVIVELSGPISNVSIGSNLDFVITIDGTSYLIDEVVKDSENENQLIITLLNSVSNGASVNVIYNNNNKITGTGGITLASFDETFNAITSIKVLEDIKVYPTETASIVNIENANGVTSYEVVNLLGQVVLVSNVEESNFSINISELSIGTYVLNLYNGNLVIFSTKIIKK